MASGAARAPASEVSRKRRRSIPTLRGNVDLREMTDQLVATVDTTMRPSHVSLWLSPRQRADHNDSANGG